MKHGARDADRGPKPKTPAAAAGIDGWLRIQRFLWRGFERGEIVFKRQKSKMQTRLAAQVAVGPAANEVVNVVVVQRRIRIESQIAVHQSESAPPRHESTNDGPSHRRWR